MYGIEVLIKEHENIIQFTEVLKQLSVRLLEGKEIDTELLRECVDFGKNYSDKQHHGKEEKILFSVMIDKLGPVANKLIKNGMLVEHDLGRYHMTKLLKTIELYETDKSSEIKIQLICHATGYADLLKRHVDKENSVVYTFAERMLSEEDKELVNKETEMFEKEAAENKVQEKYLGWLKDQSERFLK
ncbi:hemerythrin domain-containing protein [Lachnobacterium bovis]|uniref:hemerythrin domain-containing protein n=1 Tax=Lachnobacterium bovis TaxID=140626 RepID=UPI00048DBDE2|nr:hemerythrin domain-containing protein [Lachnobacterium bovis]